MSNKLKIINNFNYKQNKFLIRKIILALVGLILIFVFSRAITGKAYKVYKTVFPTYTNYSKSIDVEGYNILLEKIYDSKESGVLLFNASEGQKVPVGYEIASINLMNDTSGLKDELIRVESALKNKTDTTKYESEKGININIEKLQNSIRKKDYSEAIANINSLDISSKNSVSISEIRDLMSYSVEDLSNKKEELLQQISKSNISYKSDYSGVVSFMIDGLEEKYTSDNFEKYTYEYLLDNRKTSTFDTKTNVQKGENIFKLINNMLYYIAIPVDNIEELNNPEEGGYLTLRLDNRNITGEIIKINQSGDKAVIVLKMNEYFENIYQDRIHNYSIDLYDKKCFEIPKTAVVERDNITGVYVQEIHGLVRFVPVEVLQSNDSFYYVSTGTKNSSIEIGTSTYRTITINDAVVINPKQIDNSMVLN